MKNYHYHSHYDSYKNSSSSYFIVLVFVYIKILSSKPSFKSRHEEVLSILIPTRWRYSWGTLIMEDLRTLEVVLCQISNVIIAYFSLSTRIESWILASIIWAIFKKRVTSTNSVATNGWCQASIVHSRDGMDYNINII